MITSTPNESSERDMDCASRMCCTESTTSFIYESTRCTLKKSIRCYCTKCDRDRYVCPFCQELFSTEHKSQFWNHFISCVGNNLQCCAYVFSKETQLYEHIIEAHCSHLTVSVKRKYGDDRLDSDSKKSKKQGINHDTMVEGAYYDNGYGSEWDELSGSNYPKDFPFKEFMTELQKETPYIVNPNSENLNPIVCDLPKEKPFKSLEEIQCFLLVNHFGVTKEAYKFMLAMMNTTDQTKSYPCYDTIRERKKSLCPQIPQIIDPHYIFISIEQSIVNAYQDPFLFSQLCHSREQQSATHQRQQPYQTEIFKEILDKCDNNVFPTVIILYFDKFQKYRTRSVSTMGSYFTMLNWSAEFISKLESVILAGFSNNEEGYWNLSSFIMKEIKALDGKILIIKDPIKGTEIKTKIVLAGIVWDTPERLASLQIMKDECSKCLHMCGRQGLTPTTLFGASILDPDHTFTPTPRKIEEMNEMVAKSEVTHDSYFEDKRKKYLGMKTKCWEEIKLKDKQISSAKRQMILRKYSELDYIDNPFLEYPEVIDPFVKSVVDFSHVEIQGLFRTHLTQLISSLGFATAWDDLTCLSTKVRLPNENKISIESTVEKMSGKQMLDFIVCSAPIIYNLIFLNDNVKIPQERKTELYESWILHLQYFVRMLTDHMTSKDLNDTRKIFVSFRVAYRKCFGAEQTNFPNFHWACHTFDDCDKYGLVTWFWALLFEMKHSTYKQFNDRSNKKELEKRGAMKELATKALLQQYPWVRSLINKDSLSDRFTKLAPNLFVIFKAGDLNKVALIGNVYEHAVIPKQVYEIGILDPIKCMYLLHESPPNQYTQYIDRRDIKCICSCVEIQDRNAAPIYMLNQFALCYNYYK